MKEKQTQKSENKNRYTSSLESGADFGEMGESINTDPFGSWTGVPNDCYDKPIQDADDL